MKKFIISILFAMLLISLFSCSATDEAEVSNEGINETLNAKEYRVLEADAYDSIYGAKHDKEIDLSVTEEKREVEKENQDITFNDIIYSVTYDTTKKSYLYHSKVDYFTKSEQGKFVEFGINADTGKIDSFTWVDVDYTKNINKSELSKEECFEIAKNHLALYIDPSEYELVSENYSEIPEYKAVYDFEFRRVIDGVKTSDRAHIGVTAFGDVVSHRFTCLGDMADAKLPSDEDMQIIRTKVEEKLKSIYDSISDKYTVSYEIRDPLLIRLSDGKYAFEYSVGVSLASHDNPDMPFSELTKLLVYLD